MLYEVFIEQTTKKKKLDKHFKNFTTQLINFNLKLCLFIFS